MNENILICIKPCKAQFIVENTKCIIFFIISFLCIGLPWEIGCYIGFFLTIFFSILLLLRWWQLNSLSWTITNQRIIYIKGIISKKKEYTELYRISDYSEDPSILQAFLGLKDVYILSSDMSNPIMKIIGVKNNCDLIKIIRDQVETVKQNKKIYEVANR